MTLGQESAWLSLLDVVEHLPSGWCLIGGQMVHLHCWERGRAPQRPTDDADAAVDVRGTRSALRRFTAVLAEIGFTPAGSSLEGHQHRWVKGEAQIDVVMPTNRRPFRSLGITGGSTVQTPGAQQALNRSDLIDVRIGERDGQVPRPRLFGAMVLKAAAVTIPEKSRARHVVDFAVLVSLAGRRDYAAEKISRRDRTYLGNMVGRMSHCRELWAHIEGADEGIQRLMLVLV